jgi:hypothetical protein
VEVVVIAHDLERLVALAADCGRPAPPRVADAGWLTPWGVQFRYDEVVEALDEDAALAAADRRSVGPSERLRACKDRLSPRSRRNREARHYALAWRRGSAVGDGVRCLELDLEVFSGPFDLLLTPVLSEGIDLLEVPLGEVVSSYMEVR